MSADPILSVLGLNVAFSTPRGALQVVDGVTLTVRPGEILGLVGESGSGKSVTLRAILRLLGANATVSGEVVFKGEDVLRASEHRMQKLRGAGIGMIFQEPMTALNPVLPIGVQIEETLAAHGIAKGSARRAQAIETLRQVGIPAPEARLAS